MSQKPEVAVVFLYGADMQPDAVRTAWVGGRFIARARLSAEEVPRTAAPGPDVAEIWGILVEVPRVDGASSDRLDTITATTDDGRTLTAVAATPAGALTDPAAWVAAARYWELPPAFVAALAAAISAP